MSLWGNKELVADAGTVAINLSTGAVTGSGTSFSTGGDHAVKAGDVFVVGTGATMGYGVVVDDPTSAIAVTVTTDNLIANDGESNILEGATYYVTQMPSYVTHSAGLRAPEVKSNRTDVIYGVDSGEQDAVNAASGDARKYAAPHAGWVGVTTYIQTNADGTTELRVKTEVLVAGGADADGNGGISASVDREDVTYTG
tara:strand:- start:85 stop:678 length:594 start_codon:yes stop_codon:yes gene_type:complete